MSSSGDDDRQLFHELLAGKWAIERSSAHSLGVVLAPRTEPRAVAERALTPDEISVVRHVVDGSSYVRIGRVLGLAPTTVATRLSRALAKMGLGSRAELIVIATRLVAASAEPNAVAASGSIRQRTGETS